jgi:hypothetical protein
MTEQKNSVELRKLDEQPSPQEIQRAVERLTALAAQIIARTLKDDKISINDRKAA